jgi:carboxyl-terminal processing protease
MSARADAVKLILGDHHDQLKGDAATAIVSIDAVPEPRFAYSYVLDDRDKGNGDGVLQVGERVEMKVTVTNLGPGASEEALVTLKNMAGKPVYLDYGRDKIGAIKVGETKVAALGFTLRKPVEEVKLRVGVWDSSLGASISEELILPVHKARKAKPEKRTLRVKGDGEVPIYAGASESAQVLAYATDGLQLRSDASVASGRWRRVTLPAGAFGFLRQADATMSRGGRAAKSTELRWAPGQAPPRVDVDLSTRVTTGDVLRLRGTISDERALKDLYIFVNEKKVHYRSLAGIPVGPNGVRAPLDVTLPLKLGSNSIAVVARENDDVMGRSVFGVYRDSPNAVAERVEVPSTSAQ